MPVELVIFDCDGVLVDSEPASNRALAEAIAELGWEIGYDETVRLFKGRSERDCLPHIEREVGRVPGDFLERYRERMFAIFREELEAVDGVAEALDEIAQQVCVASSGDHEKLRMTLGHTRLLPRFEGRIFSAVDVARGKPDPDLFLHAAAQTGFSPGCCAVVEDSPLGVQAARAAGMRPLGFAGTATADARALRDAGARVFAHMRELPALLRDETA